ncbi:ATP-binding protein [Denitromonas iodatirespirans]|uniref:histidine kinase n=1 Tax=Denitromonas iodatirespirans TaxID=2795389 RepID=A0A944HBY8_DENI1|nr:ATP-binding protein [Denitromonas iodatirespirans]MBT0960716.1 HAMP domain-containing protein [Denitromonas iodatirespirans]
MTRRASGLPYLLPRSLLWQTFALLALMLLLAFAAWSQIVRHFEQAPRARDLAQMVVSIVNLTRTALVNADSDRRLEMLIDLTALEGIRVYPAEADDELTPLPNTRPIRLLTNDIRRQLGPQTRFAGSWEGLEGFWLSFRLDPLDSEEYWVMLPRERIQRPRALEWLGWGSVIMAIALLGAYLIVFRIGRPLRKIAQAARIVGQGQYPPPLPAGGPGEIAEVADAFNQMSGDLARLESDRAIILAGVSHDLRTPLARLRLGVEMSGAPSDDVRAMVSDIEEMDRVIGQFVDYGRSEPQPPEVVHLAQLISDITEPYALRGLKFALQLDDAAAIRVRPVPLRRALRNLIDNAERYGGKDQVISICTVPQGDNWQISLRDQGPGVPESAFERLKRPFVRLDEARSNPQGAGLGLAIVDRFARAHDGRFDLANHPEGGLIVTLTLPGIHAPVMSSG